MKKDYDEKIVRKLKDMEGFFRNSSKVGGNPLIYTVYRKSCGAFETGLTVVKPGTIGKEFHMTKGHRHKKALKEIYILISGKGKLVLQDKKMKVISMVKNKVYTISGKMGHRLVNVGNKELEVLTIYSKDVGRDYNLKFSRRILKK